jgi:hypothetical protein
MPQSLDFGCLMTFLRLLRIMGTRIVHMDDDTFERLPATMRKNAGNQTWYSLMTVECYNLEHIFGNVNEAVDSTNELNDGNIAFLGADFLFHSFRQLISRRCTCRVTRII